MSSASLQTLQLCVGDLQENCYLLWKTGAAPAIVFDPGDEAERIRAELVARKLEPAAFVLTHCHGDHIGGLHGLKAAYPQVPLYVPEAEADWLGKPMKNLSYFVGGKVTAPPADVLVRDCDILRLGGFELGSIHVPGHSPGGTAYFVADKSGPPHLFDGDILFQNSIGRTDFPGSSGHEVLIEGIQSKLFILPDETIVHPGHGPETTIGAEKRGNPFCGLR
ncbi:MAG: MBL fold hydrolase [Planctomycetota bacterium]